MAKNNTFSNSILPLSGDLFDFLSRHVKLLRVVIILCSYLLFVIFGLLTTKVNPLYVLGISFAPFLFFFAKFVVQRFDYAPLILLVTALFVPFTLPTGTGSRLVFSLIMAILILGLWILHSLAVEKRFNLKSFSVNVPVFGFSIVTIVSIIWSNLFRDPFVYFYSSFLIVQIASGLVMIMLPITMLMVGNFINDLKMLRWLVIVMLIAGYLGLIKNFGRIPIPVDTRGLFTLWVVGLSYGLLIFFKKLSWFWRMVLGIQIAAWIYWSFVLNISWIAGWFPGLVALGIITLMRSRKLALVLGILFILLIVWKSDYYLGVVLQNETQESGRTRLAAWQANWSITRDHILLGTGPAGYAVYYMSYFPTNAMATHSNYIDLVAQTGIIGFFFALWFFGRLTRDSYKLCRRLKGRGDFAEALANSAFGGIIACLLMMGFGDWLFPFAYTQTIAGFNYALYNWIFMGAVLVLDQLTKNT